MKWNWQQADWPNFRFDTAALLAAEEAFLRESGFFMGAFLHLNPEDQQVLQVELICTEAMKTSAIEGEILDRDSVKSSIRRNFGLDTATRRIQPREEGMGEMMVDLYRSFEAPLTQKTLFAWHRMLMKGRRDLIGIGTYRSHAEPMRVVSGILEDPTVHFEAPPSKDMAREMAAFLEWFQASRSLPALTRAGIAHLYFVSVHPFEDGNGRIARALSEKVLAQNIGKPSLIALADQIEKHRKAYYDALAAANKENEITAWLLYFSDVILSAQKTSAARVRFVIEKTRFFDRFRDQLHPRQQKVLERMFREGPGGFEGGLSADKYLRITKTSRATATRDLAELCKLGALHRTGTLKGTRYWLQLEKPHPIGKKT